MQFIFRGRFSKGLETETQMGVEFNGREPSEVHDVAAMNWFDGHPDYVRVPEDPVPEKPRPRIVAHPLDHDGNGKKGGSKKGAKATARKKKVKANGD